MNKLFRTDMEVPDLCPQELLLPNDPSYTDIAIPRPNGNVSPVELSWLMFNNELSSLPGWYSVRFSLETAMRFKEVDRIHREIQICDYMNHNLRVAARIALDPRRYATFDFAEAYDLDRSKTWPKYGERVYFEEFHTEYGVVERDLEG